VFAAKDFVKSYKPRLFLRRYLQLDFSDGLDADLDAPQLVAVRTLFVILARLYGKVLMAAVLAGEFWGRTRSVSVVLFLLLGECSTPSGMFGLMFAIVVESGCNSKSLAICHYNGGIL
jgi:hypothetical protein